MARRQVSKSKSHLSSQRMLGLALITSLLLIGVSFWTLAHAPGHADSQQRHGTTVYTVVPGDSLGGIAARYSVPASSIMAANGMTNANLVVIGTHLRIPLVSTVSGLPEHAKAVQALISTYARMYGISPAYALAVAWQESGFNQSMISRTGAIGVMQVEPDTGLTIENLLGRSLDLHSVRDNIQAGVYWLAQLVTSYGGNQRLAAAAYYQGARSVSRDGLYRDTVQYVGNVMALEARFSA